MTLSDFSPGFYADIPPEDYHRRVLGVVSCSAMTPLDRSPAHYRVWLDGGEDEEPTPALTFGSAFHCAALEPERFAREYCVEPRWGDCRKTDRTTKEDAKANKTRRDAWRAENEGKLTLSAEEHEHIRGMLLSLRKHPLTSRMLTDGVAELTLRWNDPETGLPCKARPDYYLEDLDMVSDLKSAEDARREAFSRMIGKYGFHRQRCHYWDGFEVLGQRLRSFLFVVVEKLPPYAIGIQELGVPTVERGNRKVRHLCQRLADCLALDHWPAYDETIQTTDMPPWMD